MSIPPLLGLHAYEAAARHLSFAAAAAELHLSPSAVSQRVRVLESHLGVQLFERLPRSLRLTEKGEAYLPAVRDMFQDLAASTTGLFGATSRTTLTVRVQISYAATWLAPRLPDFCSAFPHVDVQLVTAIWADALPHADSDLEIRQGNGSWPGFVSTKIHDDTAVAIYGQSHLDGHLTPVSARDLAPRERVQVLGFEDLWRRFFPAEDIFPSAPPRAVTVDTSITAIELVAHSHYWSIVPERFARAAARSGRIRVTDDDPVAMRQNHYLLRRDDASLPSGEVAAFIRWLRSLDRSPA